MNKIVENYLREYSKVVDDFLKKDEAVVERNYFFFKNFYKKENLEKASWEDLQQMGKHIHAFNSMAIARSKALGNPTQPVEKYREALMYLVYGTDPIDEKIHRIQLDEGYSLPGFGRSALTELACYTNPEEYLFLNSRDMKATEFLGITFSKKGKAGAKFIAFNKAIKPLIESYKSIIGKRTNTTIPLEVDQFLSWIYINYVPDDENLDDSDIEESIEDVLEPFLLQAQTENLKTSEYPKTYQGLNLKVSFGQGNTAKIPWISFLGNNQTTSNGIYPVYLLYKEFQKLILAYGVSETNIPKSKWLLDSNLKTIGQFFSEEGLKPDRYGESYVHSAYDLSEELDWTRINNDLNALINIYKKRILSIETISTVLYLRQPLEILKIRKDLDSACLQINESLATRYVCSLLTKKFLILTGLAGSGKTKLAQAFATWICENENQYKIVPVGADWTSREPLFGYPNALEHNKYILPDSGVLSLILKASKSENQNKPYFLILDEMNLSHVERYFADFLSAMESGEAIPLHSGESDWDGIPPSIKLPENLFIVGTVNIDETTYMFSPKVLDRANVIEFRVTEAEMRQYLNSNAKLDLESLRARGASMAASFVALATDSELIATNTDQLRDELLKFFVELKKSGAEFGYRSASEINRFVAVVNKLEPGWSQAQIMDAAIMQKLLPKVHGSRKKLEPVLKKLGELCLHDSSVFADYIKNGESTIASEKIKYPVSMEKIGRMYRALLENSFTSYAEA